MADDDNTGSQNASGASNDDAQGNTSGAGNQSTNGAAGGANEGENNNAQGAPTREELEDLKRRMQKADQNQAAEKKRADEAEAKLKDIERKDQSELEKAQGDLAEAVKANQELAAKLDEQALENAFLIDNKYSWQNPKDALRLLDRTDVAVKDGQVTGLAEAIEKLAKDKAYLLKSEEGKGGSGSSSGSATNGKRAGEGKPKDKVSSSRFPALRR